MKIIQLTLQKLGAQTLRFHLSNFK